MARAHVVRCQAGCWARRGSLASMEGSGRWARLWASLVSNLALGAASASAAQPQATRLALMREEAECWARLRASLRLNLAPRAASASALQAEAALCCPPTRS